MGHSSPYWNAVDAQVFTGPGVFAEGLKDSNGKETSIDISAFGFNGIWSTDWTDQDLLEDFLFKDLNSEAVVKLKDLNSSSLYNLYIYTGVEGGQYRIGNDVRLASYSGTGAGGDPAYGNSNPLNFIQGKNYVYFSNVKPDSGGEINIYWKSHPTNGIANGNLSGLTIEELSPIRNPIHFDVQAGAGKPYSGPSVLNDGTPIWNHSSSDINRSLVDAAGLVTSVGVEFKNAISRIKTPWSNNALLEDFLYRDLNGLAEAKLIGLAPEQTVDLYIYTGVEGCEYWVGNSMRVATFPGQGPGGDIHYSTINPWSEGKNYVVFHSVAPSSDGEILIKYRHATTSNGSNGNFSGFTLVPGSRVSGTGAENGLLVNFDFQPPGGNLYQGPNVIGQQNPPRWNDLSSPPGSEINFSSLLNSRGEVSSVGIRAWGAMGSEATSWTNQPLIGDYYYRDRNGIAYVELRGLNPEDLYNMHVYPGPEGGLFSIGSQSQHSLFSGSGPGGDPAYAPGPQANFVTGKTHLFFPGVSPDLNGKILLKYTDSPQSSAGFGLLSGMTLHEVVPLNNPIHLDIETPVSGGAIAYYAGPSVLLDKPVWNSVVDDTHVGLVDSGGLITPAGIQLFGANRRQLSDWTNHSLLRDALVRDSNGSAGALLSGLDPSQFYDVYIYNGVSGGKFTINQVSRISSYSGTGENGDPAYGANSPWIEGKNYVHFPRLRPDKNGQISISYTSATNRNGDIATFSGLSVIPVGYRSKRDLIVSVESGEGSLNGDAAIGGLNIPKPTPDPETVLLQTFSQATMSVERFVTGAFEAGKYETIRISDAALEAIGIAALTLNNVILEVKGTCASFQEGSFEIMGFKGRLSNIECDKFDLYPFKSRMFLKVPILGVIDADFWMGLAKPPVLIVGGEFSVPGVHSVGPVSFSDLRVAIDPRNNRFGAQGAAGFKGKFLNLVTDASSCPLTVSTSKRFGGGVFFKDGSLEEARLIGNNLQKQLGPNRIFFNALNLILKRDPKQKLQPIGDDNWLFNGVAILGIGCPIEIRGNPIFPITIDGTMLFGSSGDISLAGDGKLLAEPFLGAQLGMNWKNGGSASLGSKFSLFRTVNGTAKIAIGPDGYSGEATCDVTVPSGVPLVAGRKFVNQRASFRDGGLRGSINLPWGKIGEKCVGPFTINLPSVPYPCGKWYAPRVCYWTPTVTVPRTCVPTVEKSTLKISYTISGTNLDFGVEQLNVNRPVHLRTMKAPVALNEEGNGIFFYSNFSPADRYDSIRPKWDRLSTTRQSDPELIELNLPNDAPGAVITLFYENTPESGIDFKITTPDGERSFLFSEGELPDGFEIIDGFSSIDSLSKTASIYLETPQAGNYQIQLESPQDLGDYSFELLIMEPELEVELLQIYPA